jgi:hypothetical protein
LTVFATRVGPLCNDFAPAGFSLSHESPAGCPTASSKLERGRGAASLIP